MKSHQQQTHIHNVFSRVAHYYDFMNDALSLGWHRRWKKTFIKRFPLAMDQWVVDVGCGSGDLAKYMHRLYPYMNLRVIGIDPNPAMIAKADPSLYHGRIIADAKMLPLCYQKFDIGVMGFSLRNITHPIEAVKEMFRVLKPGGSLGVLDFFPKSTHQTCMEYVFHQTKKKILPIVGNILVKDKDSYDYLAKSIDDFMYVELLVHEMKAIGFHTVEVEHLSGGICTMVFAQKPQ